jgi:hypothetical protein
MKVSRKQKARKKEAKRRKSEDRKYDVLDRMLDLYGVKSLFSPLEWLPRADLASVMNPGLEVDIADDAEPDDDLDYVKARFERIVDERRPFAFDGQKTVEISLDDVYRGLFVVRNLLKCVCSAVSGPNRQVPDETRARLQEARTRAAQFEKEHLATVLGRLGYRLNDVADQFFQLDEQVIWYQMELNKRYPERFAYRIVVGRKRQLPVSLPVSEGRRKAYACERALFTGTRHATWNPLRLGIGTNDRELPVFVSEHAISRLHERMPVALNLAALHRMTFDSLHVPRLHPAVGENAFLVEAGQPGRKVGYFLVEVYADFIFVKTFLFLTMQGTPEAKCLRQKLGLSRRDIEYFKLDSFYTLACSDLGEDPELRRALAECGCDYLLDFADPDTRLSWLKRYRDPFRQELGLPSGPEEDDNQMPNMSNRTEIEKMINYSRKILKQSEGWTL